MARNGTVCPEERRRLLPDVDDMLSTSSDEGTLVAEPDAKEASLSTVHRLVGGSVDGNPRLAGSGDMALQAKPFLFVRDSKVPGADTKTVFESWTISYHAPATRVSAWYSWMGVRWWTRTEVEDAHILSVVPNAHFSQDELARVVERHAERFLPEAVAALAEGSYGYALGGGRLSRPSLLRKHHKQPQSSPAQQQRVMTAAAARLQSLDLEQRLRRLDWAVQDEVYDLLNDRVQSSSNAFRRRDWKVVMLVEVPGGEMTDAGSGPRHQPLESLAGQGCGITRAVRRVLGGGQSRAPGAESTLAPGQCMPVTEYRMILRGTETKSTEEGWESHNRYSRPWKDIDEREVGEGRAAVAAAAAAEAVAGPDKYLDF